MAFTCSSVLLWTNWKNTVIQGEISRVPVDLTVIICLGMKATIETSKGRGLTPIKYRYYKVQIAFFIIMNSDMKELQMD